MDNLLSLSTTDTPNILFHLNKRYKDNIIYTYAGKILIAINPFQPTNLYNNETINKFLNKEYSCPHLYELANDGIISDDKSIAYLISGESGSGKTESTKKLLDYFSYHYRDVNNLLPRILEFNCILEAFGNATTLRNHNSSRFGKFIKININSDGEISALIKTYLLEKIRVVSEDLSNFHIFYSFGYKLNKPEYLDKNRDDWDSSYLSRENLKNIWIKNGLGEDFWDNIESTIKLIIGLLENKKEINLNFITPEDINNVLSYKTINTGDEIIKTELSIGDTKNVIHTIAMTLYDKLFDRIVSLINSKLCFDVKLDRSFGLLDIFGFEVFVKNGFEQLCINYANERLQGIFNRYVFEEEIKMFEEEGILKSRVTFETNGHILDFFDKKNGFFPLLDEKSILNATDVELERSIPKNDSVIKFKLGSFVIKHYAENVEYNWGEFSLKNVERCSYDILEFCNKIYKNINIFSSYFKKNNKRGSIGNVTITNQFRHSLNLLVDELDKSKLYFIRCLKPNDLNQAMNWDNDKIEKQLKYCGIVSALELARQSFPVRMFIKDFLLKYDAIYLKENLIGDDWIKSLDYGDFLVGNTRLFYTRDREKELNSKLIDAQRDLIQKLIFCVKAKYYRLLYGRCLRIGEIVRIYQGHLGRKEYWLRYSSLKLGGYLFRVVIGRDYRRFYYLVLRLQRCYRERVKRRNARKFISLRLVGMVLRKVYVSMLVDERNSLEGLIRIREDKVRYELDKFYRNKIESLESRVRELEKYEGLYNDLSGLINANNESMIQSRMIKVRSNDSLPLIGEESVMDQSLIINKEDFKIDWEYEKLEYINAIQNLTGRVNYEFERVQEMVRHYEDLQREYSEYRMDIKEAQLLMSEKLYRLHNENLMLREENLGLVREMRGQKNWLHKLFF